MAGGSLRVPLRGEFYVGIGVCSHDKDIIEKAVFSNVKLNQPGPVVWRIESHSMLETVTIDSTDRTCYRSRRVASRLRTGPAMAVRFFSTEMDKSNGRSDGGKLRKRSTPASRARCNNDHGISPDGSGWPSATIRKETHESLVYIVPISGGTPRRITEKSPSYWHGWSPDGKTLAFVGQRNGDFDIYTIPAAGGEETRLTTAKGLDDGAGILA